MPLMTRSARDALAHHEWRGNLRDLVHVLEAAVSLADGEPLGLEHLQPHIQRTYLALPLHARATGFLSDQNDGQELTEELTGGGRRRSKNHRPRSPYLHPSQS